MAAGDMRVQWGACSCAQTNPPVPLEAISALYSELGRAVAIGELADRLGIPDGARLVEEVAQFVASSPTILGSVETGALEVAGLAGKVGAGLTGAAAEAWGFVEEVAAKAWRALRSAPTSLLVIGSGVALGSQYLNSQERVAFEDKAVKAALLQDVVASLDPAERKRVLSEALGASDSGGLSAWGWLGIGLTAAVGVWVYRQAVGK